ncbi:MAG: hypothetical protein K5846_03570 [Bacteroidales bacterium]|nr:hypothetical protein [Bacteroidales bacterium]
MKNTNFLKSLVLCLFGLLALTGCKKKYPSVYEYTGVWDFTIQLNRGNPCNVFTPDTIINYTGRIAHAGRSLLLIEFNQNECIEVGLRYDGKLLDKYNGHNQYSAGYMQYYGWFTDCNYVEMCFSRHNIHYLVKGIKVKSGTQ